jgi:hypothetical protein
MNDWKEIHFKLSTWEWSQLFKLFPDNGERTAFFRKCAREAIRLGPDSLFINQIRKRIEEGE